jgi:hypothetical protein
MAQVPTSVIEVIPTDVKTVELGAIGPAGAAGLSKSSAVVRFGDGPTKRETYAGATAARPRTQNGRRE